MDTHYITKVVSTEEAHGMHCPVTGALPVYDMWCTLYSHPLSAEYDYHSHRASLRKCNAVSLTGLLIKVSNSH